MTREGVPDRDPSLEPPGAGGTDGPRVVIIGAGFAGLQCARGLAGKPIDVLLVDRNNYHLFTPLLYQVASSLLNPSDIAYPVRAVFRHAGNVRFRVAEATGIDFDAKLVRTADGTAVGYDYVVIAAGSTTNFFGMEAVQRRAHGLKDLPEALELRNHILRCLEAAAAEPAETRRRRWLTFAVVGAGPTGVEYAGALSELVRLVTGSEYPELKLKAIRIMLIEALGQVLPSFPETLGREAQAELERRGIEVRLNTRVVDASERGVRLSGGETVDAHTLVWAAGVEPAALAAALGVARSGSGRVEVDEYLRIKQHPNAFAIGDIAACLQDGREVPMLSAPAMQQGRYVADAIRRLTRGQIPPPFRYRHRGAMATIGRNAAVAQIDRLSLTGFVGWVAWLLLHLYFLVGFRNRLVVLLGWAWNYLRYDRPVRLILRASERTRDRG